MDGQPKSTDVDSLRERLDVSFALKAAGLGVWELDPTTNLVNWDERCRELFGLAKENRLPYEQAIRHIHPNDVAGVDEAVQWAMNPQSDGVYDRTYRTIGADDGLLRWVRFIGRGYFTESGEVYRFAGIAQDVTKDMETQQIRASEAKFRLLIDEAPFATAMYTGPELTIDTINEAMLQLWGKLASVVGKTFEQALPELEGQPFTGLLKNVFQTGVEYSAREQAADLMISGNMMRGWFNFTYKPLRNEKDDVYAILHMAVDVTEQVLAQQKQAESEARFRSLIEEAPVATCLFVGLDLIMEVINQPMLDFFGKGNHLQGMALTDAVPELASQPFPELLRQVIRTGQTHEAVGAKAELIKNGQRGTYYVDFTYKPLRNAAGEVYAVLDMTTDVTERELGRLKIEESEERYRILAAELEQQVQQRTEEMAALNEELFAANEELAAINEELTASNEELQSSNEETVVVNEKLNESNHNLSRSNESLEKFAYIASHDLQEPLRKIQQFGDMLKTHYPDQLGEGVMYLERMQSAASRMSTLIRDLLSFSRISTQQETVSSVPLRNIIDAVLDDLELRIQETSAVVDVDDLPVVKGDRSQLEQLFQNLLNNALKFRRAGVPPIICVGYRMVAHHELPPSVKPVRLAKSYHCIQVLDNGIGFEEKYLDRIFQVFQRLHGKSEFAGTGIGLAICEKVVTNHGGAITATSQPDQGATFSVYLPQ